MAHTIRKSVYPNLICVANMDENRFTMLTTQSPQNREMRIIISSRLKYHSTAISHPVMYWFMRSRIRQMYWMERIWYECNSKRFLYASAVFYMKKEGKKRKA